MTEDIRCFSRENSEIFLYLSELINLLYSMVGNLVTDRKTNG